jgi:hypothetical protein
MIKDETGVHPASEDSTSGRETALSDAELDEVSGGVLHENNIKPLQTPHKPNSVHHG